MKKRDMLNKVILSENDIPRQWYNIQADLPNEPAPYVSPQTGQIVTPDELGVIFPKELIQQEVSKERYIDIPEAIRHEYARFRPAPLYRAHKLEKLLGTPARIYYKYEGGNATGSHKLNTALPQAYYNKEAGIKRLATETGAGQWGSALSMASNLFELECMVYMVKVSYNQKPYRRSFMETFGAQVIASPSASTASGRAILEQDPECSGSLGMAISEAVEDAATRADTNYALGSVLNHVCMHQTIIGQEAKKQLEYLDEYPDVVLGCCGGGSNFAGIAFPFIQDRLKGGKVRTVAVEPMACPTLTQGVYAYDYGDTAKAAPIAKMFTLGHSFVPSGIHAGGLRYHGASALVSQLVHEGHIEAKAYAQNPIFEAAVMFARAEGIVPAPESSHAIKGAIDEALDAKEKGEERVILFCLSGHGYFDFSAYDNYFRGGLQDIELEKAAIDRALTSLPKIQLG